MSNVKISDGIFPIDQFGKMGKIHSVFDRSFNLKVGNRLVNVANYEGYLSSFGIYLPDNLFQAMTPYVQQDNLVKIFSNGLMLYSRDGIKKITWTEYEIVSLQVKHFQLTTSQQALLKEILLEANLEQQIGLPLENKEQIIFQKMRQSKRKTLLEWQEIVAYLVGRGKGLTPSGDDILVAYLVMLHVMKDSRAKEVLTALQQPLSTTDISKEYIWYSIQGYVNSLVYQLYVDLEANKERAVIKKDLQHIMKIGHSSGKDLSFGLLLALGNDEKKERIT
ncbi:DUF2877 domain-containing protein [Enterococcus saccharolyticus]|uniref:DUF2877 domain-containing protein n=1 Tax=Candidatus Enterococcus willemsii TaxID=1857215 RepID=A0ABQ6YXD7_9ENTE|nr:MULTISPECIES: DUF2877 domain-containing protein [Enterococcus]KAF1302542.1 hypothetical protein BAU17_02310 [Enterococcus sp. CU12B]MCD5003003.1 DUF2877 domain-containing protein [Enterococcus saccharolyticus]